MRKIVIIFLCFICFLTNVYAERKEVTFESCVDGDTIRVLIEGKKTTIRFLAIDTPETKHPKKGVEPYGKEASDYTCNRVKNAKKLEIEYDKGSSKTDKYERELGWIFVDDSLLQKELIEKGYAKVSYLYGKYMYTEELQKEEEKAKESKLGVWSDEVQNETNNNTKDELKNKNDTKEEKSFIEELLDKLLDAIKEAINNLFKKIKKIITKEINKIFD